MIDVPTEFRGLARVPKPAMIGEVMNALDRLMLGKEPVDPRQYLTETQRPCPHFMPANVAP
jgi:hypothetical protein